MLLSGCWKHIFLGPAREKKDWKTCMVRGTTVWSATKSSLYAPPAGSRAVPWEILQIVRLEMAPFWVPGMRTELTPLDSMHDGWVPDIPFFPFFTHLERLSLSQCITFWSPHSLCCCCIRLWVWHRFNSYCSQTLETGYPSSTQALNAVIAFHRQKAAERSIVLVMGSLTSERKTLGIFVQQLLDRLLHPCATPLYCLCTALHEFSTPHQTWPKTVFWALLHIIAFSLSE